MGILRGAEQGRGVHGDEIQVSADVEPVDHVVGVPLPGHPAGKNRALGMGKIPEFPPGMLTIPHFPSAKKMGKVVPQKRQNFLWVDGGKPG